MGALDRLVKENPTLSTTTASPILDLIASSTLVKQGAEAVRLHHPLLPLCCTINTHAVSLRELQKVYKSTLYPSPTLTPPSSTLTPSPPPPLPILIKHRFPKTYRHSTLDALLTRQRLTSEARALVRCLKAGVKVPGLRIVDVRQGVVGMEWIEGWSVREVLGGGQEDDEGVVEDEGEVEEEAEEEEDVQELLRSKGVEEGAFAATCWSCRRRPISHDTMRKLTL